MGVVKNNRKIMNNIYDMHQVYSFLQMHSVWIDQVYFVEPSNK